MILILEPDHTLRDLMSLALRRQGFEVTLAADPADALRLLEKLAPQVLLLAGLLPQINGIDLLKYCHSRGLVEHTAVILISALGYREIVQKALAAGAADFLVKPIDVDVLSAKVQKYAGRRPEPASAPASSAISLES
jgi:two-component system response regulator MprA